MREYWGSFKAYMNVQLPEGATEQEVREALANRLSDYYFANVYPEDVTLEENPNK